MTQSLPLRDQIEKLVQIQEIDLKILRLSQKKDSLPGILQEVSTKLDALEKRFNDARTQVDELEKALKQVLAAMELNRERISRTEKKVDGVTNTKEFSAASKEIEQLNKHNAQLEAQKTEAQSKYDLAKDTLAKLEEERNSLQGQRETRSSEVSGEAKVLEGDISALSEERGKYLGGIDKAILLKYERIRGAKGGLGLVPAIQGRCKGCNLMIPPQIYNQVIRCQEVMNCPSCQRIVFVTPASAQPVTQE